jgi:hypothetical protein
MNGFRFTRNSRSVVKTAAQLLSVILGLLVFSVPLFSQGGQGTIQGSVFDQSGGAVAGSAVTVTDVARGVSRNLLADSAGEFVASSLNPGTYTVRATANGFKAVEHSGVLVEVGQNIRVDLVLEPGEQSQTVTVTAEIPSINTTDATLGGTVSNSDINSLPLNGRNFDRLLQLRPGVVTSPGATSGVSSTNGRRTGADVLFVEGIPQIELTTAGSTLNGSYKGGGDTNNLLPIDAIQEFSTQQNPKAEYGWRDGSVVVVGVKSGTNSLHGTAYAFGRDGSATDAANPFTHTVTAATLEQFGATAGGPIVKNKIFWFVGYEGLRLKVSDVSVDTVPYSIAEPAAVDPTNELSMVNACNALNPTHAALGAPGNRINGLSAQLAGLNPATCVVTPANNTATGENLFPYMTSTTSNNYVPGLPNTAPLNNGLVKGDWALSEHHHLNGMYYVSKSTSISTSGNLLPQWSSVILNDTQMYDGDWTWTPNSTWVNDLRMGYSYGSNQSAYGDQAINPANPWPSGYGLNTGVTKPLYGGLPNIVISSFNGPGLGVGGRSGIRGPDGEAEFRDSVSYLRGKHSFKFGFEFADAVLDEDPYSQAQGVIKFKTLQAYLTGSFNSASILAGDPSVNRRQHWFAGFVQDDWRLTPRITLNLGLRYEYYAAPTERNNLFGTFNPNVNLATTPAVQQVGAGSSLYIPEKTDFSPRGGFAWDIRGNGKTVLRVGGGLMTSIVPLSALAPIVPWGANFPSLTPPVITTGTNANLHTPLNLSFGPSPAVGINWSPTVNSGGPTVFPIGTAGPSCTPAVPCSTGAPNVNFKQPRSAQWNLDIQRVLAKGLTMDVAYVGNHGFREQHSVDLNFPTAGVGAGWDASAVNTCIASAATNYNKCTPDKAAEAGPYTNTIPYLNYIIQSRSDYYSNYDGLQVTVDQRLSHGLSFLAGYTYSHALDLWSKNSLGSVLPTDPTNLRMDYGNGDNDIRHRFTFSPSYAIPGKKSPGQMLEGWTLSAILVVQGGLPWSPADFTTDDLLGTGENKENYISSNAGIVQAWNYSGPRSAFTSNSTPIPQFTGAAATATCATAATAPYTGNAQLTQLALASLANLGCYAQGGGILTPPAYGTNGNASRNLFRGPSYNNVDFSVSKIWHLKERYSAQFRAEFFNIFNRADFAAPGVDPTAAGFGYATSTPDSSNPVLGSGGPRHIQFGLKLTF